uniref:Transposase DDE domain-containing protein n=1 Tax=Candidatus Kentrum eta TaxID=2126337 RepID=A0A450UV83_9GAMM|nr:MAG: Transposase DDE domain-containing protein [Candidatus Kentron sp. H]VFJ97524.1 MAG: Transposase DDE domain-containing protein [Candidatus Kentron sp. H]VFK02830.1 MAG: Transposase DDE domain-containing protein [Candidatus Kentron sp. H]
MLLDTMGFLLLVILHAANIQDRDGVSVKRNTDTTGFVVLPGRQAAERTFGWFGKYQRLSKDYEVLTRTSEAMIYASVVHLMTGRLARKAQPLVLNRNF